MSAVGRANARQPGRRAALPGADELFRSTGDELVAGSDGSLSGDGAALSVVDAASRGRTAQRGSSRLSSGRQRHDEKITVYVSSDELVQLERARLALRADHGLAVDRGRIVREALAHVLADLAAKGEASLLVRQLREG